MLQLSKEDINQTLEDTAPLIVFFGLSEKEQVSALPILEERKYNFPAGDLITNNALEILVSAYEAQSNSIVILLRILQDGSDNEIVGDLFELFEKLLDTTHEIVNKDIEEVNESEWGSLRQLSLIIQKKLKIQLAINVEIVRNYIEYWLHP